MSAVLDKLDDCWRRIGVAGNRSCDKLAIHTHCRNCDVYAGAAQRNLQRPLGQAYRLEWAAHFRQPQIDQGDTDSAALVFRIGAEWLALPTSMLDSVAPSATPHRLPHRGGALLGVVNVGGTLRPAVSLDALLGIEQDTARPAEQRHVFARLLMVQWQGIVIALPVTDLDTIVRYAATALATPAATVNKGLVPYLSGVLEHHGRQIGCLDPAILGRQFASILR
jgi:chemotaxis-related protein WspD